MVSPEERGVYPQYARVYWTVSENKGSVGESRKEKERERERERELGSGGRKKLAEEGRNVTTAFSISGQNEDLQTKPYIIYNYVYLKPISNTSSSDALGSARFTAPNAGHTCLPWMYGVSHSCTSYHYIQIGTIPTIKKYPKHRFPTPTTSPS